jgi:predicted ATPase
MDSITLKNFRCFRELQTARLAPLTLLVGENSTGKTSFLAMVRILSDIASKFRNPDFKEDPYDLGSFDEIAHHRGGRGSRADQFEAGFTFRQERSKPVIGELRFTFGKSGSTPIPVRRYLAHGKNWIDEIAAQDGPYSLQVGTARGSWKVQVSKEHVVRSIVDRDMMIPSYYIILSRLDGEQPDGVGIIPLEGSPPLNVEDRNGLMDLSRSHIYFSERTFASAPVRSKPHRTYDPARPTPDPEGDYVPMYLADVYSRDRERWKDLKKLLERYGETSGLFDEISIKRLGSTESEPFQVQLRKSGGKTKGPWRNLIDVGYGVSQALPVITELLRNDAAGIFLLQQPEVHLHPQAQAALGSLFCEVIGPERQLIVETHSDHLLDRVRMEVRDSKGVLSPDDISILFFERGDLEVRIHSLTIDDEGNILGAPDSYRRFFMEETARSLGF